MQSFTQYIAEQAAFNIARSSMPQLNDQAGFVAYLNSVGVPVDKVDTAVDSLRPTQVDFDQAKVDSITQPYGSIIASYDGNILDGHHRWRAAMNDADCDEINTYICHAPINQLLKHANDYLGNE